MKPVLVTGAAGFIGFHLSKRLLEQGVRVIGVDNLNAYYDPRLKQARLAELEKLGGDFTFIKADIADEASFDLLLKAAGEVEAIAHLAAQPGVRYSLEAPRAYTKANVDGTLNMLELCRALGPQAHLAYASSSSVYGANKKLPFSVEDPVDHPVSLYAATKKATELMADCYSRLYGIPATGLRFFTVYGPWGRPDMAAWKFTQAITQGKPIDVYNHGDMRRDFTFIDDIINGLMAVLGRPPEEKDSVRHRVYNLGNHRSEKLTDFIAELEKAIGIKAQLRMQPMQPGDVQDTYADIEASRRDFGFSPKTSISQGIPAFVDWYKMYHLNR
ncbi:SDR family NAD(P)-dependent oxidoreductase [bacterium]|nr:SDR family NAD(P)-dependent oxidoreductase [bacterium]